MEENDLQENLHQVPEVQESCVWKTDSRDAECLLRVCLRDMYDQMCSNVDCSASSKMFIVSKTYFQLIDYSLIFVLPCYQLLFIGYVAQFLCCLTLFS